MKTALLLLLFSTVAFCEETAPPADDSETPAEESKPLVTGDDAAKMLAEIKAKRDAKQKDALGTDTQQPVDADAARKAFVEKQEAEKKQGELNAKKRRMETLERNIHAKAKEVVRLANKLAVRQNAASNTVDPTSGEALKGPAQSAIDDLKKMVSEYQQLRTEFGIHRGKKEPNWQTYVSKANEKDI